MLRQFLHKRLAGRIELQRVIANTGWLVADHVIQIVTNLFVGVLVARHLGPEQRGIMIYASSLTSIIVPISALGLGSILIRELVQEPDKKYELMGTVFVMQAVSYLLFLPLILGSVFLLRSGETEVIWAVIILAAGSLFSTSRIFNFWFQAQLQAKYIVWATRFVEIVSAVLKIILILTGASVLAFVGVLALQVVMYFFTKLYIYSTRGERIFAWRFNQFRAKSLLRDSWPLIFSVLAVTLYTEIDNLMLGQLLDNHAVGIYGEATRSIKTLYFIPAAIATSVYPTMVSARKTLHSLQYGRRVQQYLDILTLAGFGLAIPVSLFAPYLVSILYGPAYAESGKVLTVYVWTFVFISMRYGLDNWFMVENRTLFTMWIAIFGLLLNVLLNYWMVPRYGVIGAAWATLISNIISIYSICLIFPQIRPLFFQLIYALFAPFRIHKLLSRR